MCCNWPCRKKPKALEEGNGLAPRHSLSRGSNVNSAPFALGRVSTPTLPASRASTHANPASKDVPFEQSLGLALLVPGDQPVVDIVAVHGLDGHREKSWTAENGNLWLKDYLPKTLSDASARIFTYGYDGRTYGSTPLSCQTLYDHAISLVADLSLVRRRTKTTERPIIFLAHSIGGIILKSALIHANLTGEHDLEYHKAIKISTYGILFFGTPHQGADNFNWDQVFLNIASQSRHTSDIVLKNLGSGSEWLQQQLGQYTRISSHFETKFFYEAYETKHHRLGTSVIVPRDSAVVPGATNAEAFAINSDHAGLVKYGSMEDNGFQRVSDCIFLMVEQAPGKIRENWQQWRRMKSVMGPGVRVTFEISFELDYRRNANFIGRAGLLNNLDAMIKGGKSKLIILHGTGGMGKTQIALEYAYSHATEYTAVFWVNAASIETATASFIAIAHRLITQHALNAMNTTGNPEYFQVAQLLGVSGLVNQDGQLSTKKEDSTRIIQAVKRWFSQNGNEDWLLILDNVDDLDTFDIGSFLPSPCHGTVIMTSRRRECVRLGAGLEITAMLEQEAVLLLLTVAQLKESRMLPEDETVAIKLTARLGYLPLSIDQAGAYISTRNITLEKYLKIFEENFSKFSNERPPDPVWSYGDRTAFTTWEISFEAIKSENENAAELLLLCSFLSNEDIWEDMLRRGKELGDKDLTLGNSLRLLFSYSLAQRMRRQREGKENFYIHPMVHEWARERLSQQEILPRAKEAVILLGQAVKPSQKTSDAYQFEQRIMSHIEMVLRNTQKYLKTEIEHSTEASWMGSILLIVRAYRIQGRLRDAEELELQVVEAIKRILGNEHPDTLTAIGNLAITYRDQGRPKEAEKLERQIVEVRERVLGKDDPATLTTMSHLALSCWSQGGWKEAEELNLQVIEARKRVFGEDHVETLSAISNLVALYLSQGEWEKGEELGLPVVEAMNRVLGKEHPDTLKAMGNLAMIYLKQGQLKNAEELQVQVYESAKTSPGKEHPESLTAMENLATIYADQGRLVESEELEIEVTKMRKKVLGEEHPDTLLSMSNLAAVYSEMGKFKEAEELQVQVLEVRRRVLGKDHQDTLTTMANLMVTYWRQGLWAKAVEAGLLVVEAFEKVLGKDHPDTLRTMGNLATIYSNQGRWMEAEKLEIQVVKAREEKLGKEHPDTLMAMANLATTFSNQKRFEETEELNLQVLEGRSRVLGKDHPGTWEAMSSLASTYTQQRRLGDAEKLQLQIIEARTRALGKEHPKTLDALENLVVTYWGQGRSEKAEELSLQVVEMMTRVLGKEHPSTLKSMTNLAEIYLNQERWKEAEDLQRQVLEAWKSIPGESHHSWSAMADLVVTYLKQGRLEQAEEEKQQLVEAMEKKLGKGHPDIIRTEANLANVLKQ